jgi:hypothetical protein
MRSIEHFVQPYEHHRHHRKKYCIFIHPYVCSEPSHDASHAGTVVNVYSDYFTELGCKGCEGLLVVVPTLPP